MRQVVIPRFGAPEVLTVRESPDPTPGKGQVRVRVAAAGINFADIAARMGLYPDAPPLPMVVGYEAGGTIDALGEGAGGASGLKVGDDVIAMTRFGGYSDVVCVPEATILKRPKAMTADEGAAMPVTYLTAWHSMVVMGNLRPGERVLIHSAGGGVGTAAIQIARMIGAETIGTASASKHEALKKLGLDHAIDYTTTDFEPAVRELTKGKGVHLILDPVGGASWKKGYRLLAQTGRLCCFGYSEMTSGRKTRSLFKVAKELLTLPKWSPLSLMDGNRGIFGVNMGHLWDEASLLRSELAQILAGYETGKLKPIVDRAFPFAEAAAAHTFIQARKNLGKVLLKPT
jgi:NADPH:quinone reductase-like Zn-dependent oxidoreductase